MALKKVYVIGSGPNGLAAAITLARAGVRVTLLEAEPTLGGGTRSAALTLPGFVHDVCSAVHPLALSSPFFRGLPLAEHGLKWIQTSAPLAHPLADGQAVMLERSVEETARHLGRDGPAYRRAVTSLVAHWETLVQEILGPLHWPRHPLLLARFGWLSLWPAASVARALFRTAPARALFAGLSAHSILPLEKPASAASGWVLAWAGHAVGWPIPRGGSQRIADALASYCRSVGAEILTGTRVGSLDELKEADAVLCDITPRQLLCLSGSRLPEEYRRKLERYRYGPGVYKMDWALSGPIPWQASQCARAATVHLGGTLEQIAASERQASPQYPFVLLAQPSLFDSSRAPRGRHTAWAYCHVPNGSADDMTAPIESQIERAAPGFRGRILARHAMGPADMEKHNANLVGGDISGGAQDLGQLFWRPTRQLYRTPLKGLYLCSASTPPGGGVHGMCGYHAARAALADFQSAANAGQYSL